jgi:hypothetical protein
MSNQTCRHCGSVIVWGKSIHGKPQPFEPDGITAHHAKCPALKKTAKPLPADCAACGSQNLEVRTGKGAHAGELRCGDCGRWIKWISHEQYQQIGGPTALNPEQEAAFDEWAAEGTKELAEFEAWERKHGGPT